MVDRVYQHGKVLVDAINEAEYTNNDPVASTPELSKITIHDWDNVKTSDKLEIESKALVAGYSVVS